MGARRFCWQQPDEYRLDESLKALAAECEAKGMETECADTEHFYTYRTELADFFKGKKTYRLENFYRAMRAKHTVLMDALGEPEGGQWNFDANNRQKLPKDHVIPPPKLYYRDVATLQAMLEAAGVETTGQLDGASWGWPLTREEGLDLLDYFVDVLLPHFGDYQDALTPDSWSVYHSRLSFAMNTKLLSPDEVNRTVEQAWRSNPERVSISQAEGSFGRSSDGASTCAASTGRTCPNTPSSISSNTPGHYRIGSGQERPRWRASRMRSSKPWSTRMPTTSNA